MLSVGDLVMTHRQLENKLTPLYLEETLDADLGTSVLIIGRVVNKDNLK